MPIPCTNCKKSKRGHSCVLSKAEPELSRCSNCVRRGRSCDAKPQMPKVSEYDSIDRQKQRIDEEEEAVFAKLLRLKQQKKLLVEKGEGNDSPRLAVPQRPGGRNKRS